MTKDKSGYKIGRVTPDEMEYLQCGLHQFIVRNRENSQRTHLIQADGETHEIGPDDDAMADFWATQNVEAQKLLDKLIAITGGRDLAQEGQ